MDRSRVAIVIPALNEARTITQVVSAVLPYGETWVVDDGSADDTGELARAAGAHVVRHNIRRGYDKALNTGFAHAASASCACLLTIDADGQHNPLMIAQFIQQIERGADVVVGVRDRRQRVSEHLFAWTSRALWGVDDPLCGMKAYQSNVYHTLGHFDSFGSVGTELCLHAARTGRRIVQIPLKTLPRHGQPRFGSRLRGNWLILRALLKTLARGPG